MFVPGKPPVDYQGARDVKPIAEFALQQVCNLLFKIIIIIFLLVYSFVCNRDSLVYSCLLHYVLSCFRTYSWDG